MTHPHALASRAEGCVRDTEQGMACLLKVESDELEEARRLIGEAPVIVATHEEAMRFLSEWMRPMFGERRR